MALYIVIFIYNLRVIRLIWFKFDQIGHPLPDPIHHHQPQNFCSSTPPPPPPLSNTHNLYKKIITETRLYNFDPLKPQFKI